MINKFILQQYDMKTHNTELAAQIDMTALTHTIMASFEASADKTTSALSKKAIITAIEKYNTDNNLASTARVKYAVLLGGGSYINVCYAYFSTNHTNMVVLVGYDNANYQATFKSNGKIDTLKQAVSTHIVALDDIIDVQFGKYDSTLENIISGSSINERTGNVYIEGLEKKLLAVYSELFPMIGAGRIKDFITKFNIEFVKNQYNVADYTGNVPAHDLYIKLWSLYLSTVAQIIVDKDSTIATESKLYKYVTSDSDLPDKDTQDYQNTFSDAEIALYRNIEINTEPANS